MCDRMLLRISAATGALEHPPQQPDLEPFSRRSDVKTVSLHGKKAAGRVVLVDDEDYDLVAGYRWHVVEQQRRGRSGGPYAGTTLRIDSRTTGPTILMHCLIMGCLGVDHRFVDALHRCF